MSAKCQGNNAGCPKNVANGCCRSRPVCCKEKSEFQESIQQYNDEINAYKLQLRLLSDQFKKRASSKCDDFTKMSKNQYELKRDKLQDKIDSRVKSIKKLKNAKRAGLIVRDEESFCRTGAQCSSC